MNWPINPEWRCPVCGNNYLVWGFVYGQCRCDTCHAVFTMCKGLEILTEPRCLIKPDSLVVFKNIWIESKTKFDEMTDELWERGFSEAGLVLPKE